MYSRTKCNSSWPNPQPNQSIPTPVPQAAAKFGVTRETQDQFAASSHAKAAHAQSQGLFDAEIVPG